MSRTVRNNNLSIVLASVALMTVIGPVSAATWTKTATSAGGTCQTVNNASAPASCTLNATTASDANATLAAFGNTGANGAWAAANITTWGGGLGVVNKATAAEDKDEGGDPEHAFDNDGRTDAMLYKFDKTVALTSLATGWSRTDQDITVLRYTGTGAPSMGSYTLSNGATPTSNMLSNGWALMGNYAYAAKSGTSNISLNNSGLWASSHWLVMAYSTAFGGAIKGSSGASQTLTGGNDYFKLLSVSGVNSNKVSEPAVLALAGLGLFGVAWSRRTKKQGN